MSDANKFIETFKEEAFELLGTLEEKLLELEEQPDDKELLSAVFRVMHTIKGSAAMFGLDRISSFSHEVESILSALRDGKLQFSKALIGNTLLARDLILGMLEDPAASSGPMTDDLLDFLAEFRKDVGFAAAQDAAPVASATPQAASAEKSANGSAGASVPGVPAAGAGPDAGPESGLDLGLAHKNRGAEETWHITFKPGKDLFRRGTNPLSIIAELEKLGECVRIPLFADIPTLSSLDPEDCLTGWEIFLTTTASENDIRDVFIFVVDSSDIRIECLCEMYDERAAKGKKLGEILVERGTIKRETLDRVLQRQRRIGEILMEEKLVTPADLKIALEEQKQIQKAQKNKIAASDMSTIRVKSEKLDQLMSLVGELVTIHAQIMQAASMNHGNDGLVTIVEQFGRLTDELRSNTMSIRMIPIGTTFSSFKRLVRDLSAELGKNVELVTEGGDTELDKTVIEKLNDPLIHIIRNSLDHGIEVPDVRRERGKPPTGTIALRASQTGASVYIVIEDDGNGLDVEKIRNKAIAKGLISAEDTLADEDVYRLIFAPGFSTKDQVSALSGRGVGMDVVNRQMELINGTVEIESKSHEFMRITLKIPLTLAIIDGLLVRIGVDHFVIPLSVVVGCLEYDSRERRNEGNIVIFHDRQLPFIDMRDFFAISGDRPAIEQMVVVNIKDQHVGLLVDQVVGGNQTVIKPLGKVFKQADGVSSATVLGDGSVALILDVEQIVGAKESAGV
ncbi:MAG TPA: chemotaxis protein CheA [Treponemataceae bacterium]|nr:chemotaxis protein CheA [Treponemataceae bacterium]